VLAAVQFHGDSGIGAKQIDFEASGTIERDREREIDSKPTFRFGERFQPSEENASVALRARAAPSASGDTGRVTWVKRLASGVSTPSRTSRRTVPE